jgi:very-short-patch-repair endonuclease
MRASSERLIDEMAARQHGVVTRQQLLDAGIQPRAVARRVESGRLRPMHRGVYQVGPLPGPKTFEMAAVLACGPTAAISHGSAARMHGIPVSWSKSDPVSVSVVYPVARARPGIQVHRVRVLPGRDVTRVERIAVVTAVRAIVDLTGVLATRDLERVVAFVLREHLTDEPELRACAVRRGNPAGIALLMTILNSDTDPAFTRSEAEARFLELIRGTGIRIPETNARVAGLEVDFVWRKEKVIVEVDGYQYHGSRRSYHRDRARDRKLAAEGYLVIRVTWDEIVNQGPAVLVSLARALALRGR